MPNYNDTLRSSRLDLVRDAIDAGAGAGTVKIYSGTKPATGAALTDQVLLTTGTFSDPSAPNATGGVLTFDAITYTSVQADGVATWGRVEDSDGTFVADMTVGDSGSGEDIELAEINLLLGASVDHIGATITEGNA